MANANTELWQTQTWSNGKHKHGAMANEYTERPWLSSPKAMAKVHTDGAMAKAHTELWPKPHTELWPNHTKLWPKHTYGQSTHGAMAKAHEALAKAHTGV